MLRGIIILTPATSSGDARYRMLATVGVTIEGAVVHLLFGLIWVVVLLIHPMFGTVH